MAPFLKSLPSSHSASEVQVPRELVTLGGPPPTPAISFLLNKQSNLGCARMGVLIVDVCSTQILLAKPEHPSILLPAHFTEKLVMACREVLQPVVFGLGTHPGNPLSSVQ